MNVPAELKTLIARERSFCIAAHINPDGDALGSALALSLAFESMGKTTILYDRDNVPAFYCFLPGHERFTNAFPADGLPLILVDCNEPERAGIDGKAITSSAVIDHHETVRDFGDVRWIEPQAAATGMMVYHLIKELGVKITREIAKNLYTAIAVDTGTFRYSNTTSEVLRACAELVDAGADPGMISVALYESWSEGRFRLLLRVLDTLEITGSVAMTHVTREMFEETGTKTEDTEHFSNFPRMMGKVKVAAFFREIDGGWRVSLRSKGNVDVSKTAELFRGGGHRNAAGFRIIASLDSAKESLLKALSGNPLS